MRRYEGPLEQVDDCCWRIPRDYRPGMRVDGLVFADAKLIETIRTDQALEQVANVAFLPGIEGASLAMPDIHWGYGLCISGVCSTDTERDGGVSTGGGGYCIPCGGGGGAACPRQGRRARQLKVFGYPIAGHWAEHGGLTTVEEAPHSSDVEAPATASERWSREPVYGPVPLGR